MSMPRRLAPPAIACLLLVLGAVAVFAGGVLAADDPLPPVGTVEEARERLRMLREASGRVEAWVEEHKAEELGRRLPPGLLAPRGPEETDERFQERRLRVRLEAAELGRVLRAERIEWIARERKALLAQDIVEELTVRLGPYDAERGEYPVLLGFGWPAGLQIWFRVREREKPVFDIRFPRSFPARLRVDEKGEATLDGLDKGKIAAQARIFVPPAGPRLLWQGRHASWVTAVAVRPDGGQVVSAGAEGALIGWDAETGNTLFRTGDAEMALALAFSPDGAVFATGASDATVRLRDSAAGKEIWQGRGDGMIFSVAFSPDGRHLATGDDSGHVRIWDVASGTEVRRQVLGSPVRAVAFTREGDAVAAGCEEGGVVLWDRRAGRTLWRRGVGGAVRALSASPAGDLLAVAGGGRIAGIRRDGGDEAWSRPADEEIRAVRFDPSGRLVAFGGSGYKARILEGATGIPLWEADVGSPVRSLDFGPSGMRLAVGSADFAVRLFDVVEGDRVVAAYGPGGRIYVSRDRAARIFGR